MGGRTPGVLSVRTLPRACNTDSLGDDLRDTVPFRPNSGRDGSSRSASAAHPSMKIELKFTLAMVVGIVVVHGVSAGVRLRRLVNLFEESAVSEQEVLGRTLSHAVGFAFAESGEPAALELVKQVNEIERGLAIRWLWLDQPQLPSEADDLTPEDVAELHANRSLVARKPEGESSRFSYFPVLANGDRLGAIQIEEELSDERIYLQKTVRNAVFTALAMMVLSTALAWGLGTALIGRPVRRLVEQAQRVGRGDLEFRLSEFGSDELGELAAEMNSMCDRLAVATSEKETESRARITAIEQLRHADRLTTVGTLASGLAHQLGTPINVIEGHVQLLREQAGSDAEPAETLDVITRQCKRMTGIIRQLLDFSRRCGGSNGSVADLNEVARETLRLVEPLARRTRVQTRLLESESAAKAAIAYDQVQQVVANIVINGLHAMPDGGILTLHIQRVDVARPGSGEASRAHCCVVVEDSGIGMDPSTMERVFEPFFTTKDVGEGTGLGLSVAYGIVKDHGGWIDVVSAPRRGSRFLVYLPAESER